tara:strand:+ start:744 stop:1043 length:300 start_codon:yes stop_codon:yes gene_type:complete
MDTYILKKSKRDNKRLVIIMNENMKHHFGLKGGKTFIDGRSEKERQNYIARHKVRENWNKSGIHTAGFWSYHLLWNKPTLQESINDVEKRFNIKIINKT